MIFQHPLSSTTIASIRNQFIFWVRMGMFFISAIVIGTIVIDYGFIQDKWENTLIFTVYHYAWWIYFIVFSFRLGIYWQQITRKTVFMTAILGVLLYLSAIPEFITVPKSWHFGKIIWSFFSSKFYLITVLGIFSVLEVSRAVISFINKKTNPALLMSVCFAIIIAFGTLLLLLPRSTHDHLRLPIIDALFISTSAVCITGLSTVDIAQTFSWEGQIVIMLLIQIGGLGIMTITSFFALFFMGDTGLYNQFALKDIIGSDTFSSLISTLLHIVGFTFIIEIIGALCIWLSIHGTMKMTIQEELFFSIFHAISAFCNAGFSTLTGNLSNPLITSGHNGFFLIISVLIILGGIGFPILANFKQLLVYYAKQLRLNRKSNEKIRFDNAHHTNINTKIVLVTTAVLIIISTILIAVLEWHGVFSALPVWDKIVQSFFNAVAPRTAGFNSVDLSRLSFLTTMLYMILMWIGGASQSTAGGIKVNTFAVACANFISVIKGHHNVILFHREIASDSVRRASATIFGSIIIITSFFMTLVVMEPHLPPEGLLFETLSAFCTVGSSLDITPVLGDDSKILLSILMFIGRIGLLTMLISIMPPTAPLKYHFPKGDVIIN